METQTRPFKEDLTDQVKRCEHGWPIEGSECQLCVEYIPVQVGNWLTHVCLCHGEKDLHGGAVYLCTACKGITQKTGGESGGEKEIGGEPIRVFRDLGTSKPVLYFRYKCPVCGFEEVQPEEAGHLCGDKCAYQQKMEVYNQNQNGEQREQEHQELE